MNEKYRQLSLRKLLTALLLRVLFDVFESLIFIKFFIVKNRKLVILLVIIALIGIKLAGTNKKSELVPACQYHSCDVIHNYAIHSPDT